MIEFFGALCNNRNKTQKAFLIIKNALSIIATHHDMMNGIWDVNTGASTCCAHSRKINAFEKIRNTGFFYIENKAHKAPVARYQSKAPAARYPRYYPRYLRY